VWWVDGVRSNLGQNMGTSTSALTAAANQLEQRDGELRLPDFPKDSI
jgi:hypothetical protein